MNRGELEMMTKTLSLFSAGAVLFSGCASVSPGHRSLANDQASCPTQIVLSDVDFFGENFPNTQQIQVNLNKKIVDDAGRPNSTSADLEELAHFVRVMSDNYKALTSLPSSPRSVTLTATLQNGSCGGSVEDLKYTYDRENGVTFSNLAVNPQEAANAVNKAVTIPIQSPAKVSVQFFFASNCSNCSGTASLFNFKTVTVR
jgi:hypothetical protein